MKRVIGVCLCGLVLTGTSGLAGAIPVAFTFESANGVGPIDGVEYGSSDPQGFSALVRDGFVGSVPNVDISGSKVK